jgi:REP element-mobilizing transposase RayT
MTPPRYIVENQLCFVTCGAVGRSFRFVPKPQVVELIWYVLAVMAQRTGIQIHEALFMSNHFHLVATDRDGVLPDFMRDFNSLLSRGLNALRGSTGTNVEKGYNLVVPTDDAKLVEHAVYTLTNPCNEGLVERAGHWKGVTTHGIEYGDVITRRRPNSGLWKSIGDAVAKLLPSRRNERSSVGRRRHADRTKLPETASFTLVRPPVMLDHSDAQLRRLIYADVRRVEDEQIVERRRTGRRVVGMQRVAAQSYTDTPDTARELFRTTPRVSGKTRAWLETLRRRLEFERAHAVARAAIIEVMSDARALGRHLAERLAAIELPRGSFLLRRRYECVCASSA